jgi:hypothetical protein
LQRSDLVQPERRRGTPSLLWVVLDVLIVADTAYAQIYRHGAHARAPDIQEIKRTRRAT